MNNTPAVFGSKIIMPNTDLLRLSAQIVSAHVGNNTVQADQLPEMIRTVYAALDQVSMPTPPVEPLTPAVPIKKSVFPGYIVCLEDGKRLKMLKRHLLSAYGLTPAAYRARWGLPDSYPMTAPDYAARRSALALEIGLGRASATPAVELPIPVQKVAEGVRGKKPKKTATPEPETGAKDGE